MTRLASRIVLVEDHRLLAESIGLALSAEGYDVGIANVGDGTDTDTVVAAVAPDASTLVLLDLELGQPLGDGTALIAPLRACGATVLVVTGVTDRMRLAATIDAGAVGVVAKNAPFDELLSTVVRAARGERIIEENDRLQLIADLRAWRARRDRTMAPFEQLTGRERQVLARLAAGQSVDAIARGSFVSE